MKSRLMSKAGVLVLFIIILFTMLSGCSKGNISNANENSENTGFRGIPFGTKYVETIELIEKDFEEQGYVMDKTEGADTYNNRWFVNYNNVKLYDYLVEISLRFEIPSGNKEDTIPVTDDNKENTVFIHASYTIRADDLNECFQYFHKKLDDTYVNKYGDFEWINGDTLILIMNTGIYITISYDMIDWERVKQVQSANRGL